MSGSHSDKSLAHYQLTQWRSFYGLEISFVPMVHTCDKDNAHATRKSERDITYCMYLKQAASLH